MAFGRPCATDTEAGAVTPAGLSNADREARALDAVDRAVGYGVTCASPGMTCTVVVDDTCGLHGCAFVELDYDYGTFPLIPAVGSLVPMPDHLVYEASAEVS